MTNWTPTIANCDDYMAARSGKYQWRAVRYRAAADWLVSQGLSDSDTVVDIGAGWTEFDYCLRKEYDWKGRYYPVDGGLDETNLEHWIPSRDAEFFVGLEIMEHLYNWEWLVGSIQARCLKGVALSTPNPRTTDVLGMDETHVVEVRQSDLERLGFSVEERTFYGGMFSDGEPDSLFATWRA